MTVGYSDLMGHFLDEVEKLVRNITTAADDYLFGDFKLRYSGPDTFYDGIRVDMERLYVVGKRFLSVKFRARDHTSKYSDLTVWISAIESKTRMPRKGRVIRQMERQVRPFFLGRETLGKEYHALVEAEGLQLESPEDRYESIRHTEEIFYSKDMPVPDLKAQLLILLLRWLILDQVAENEAFKCLADEFVKGFKLGRVIKDQEDRDEIRRDVVGKLVMRWKWPDSYQAFRMFVKEMIKDEIRQRAKFYEDGAVDFHSDGTVTVTHARGDSKEGDIGEGSIYREWLPNSVDQAAARLEVSPGYLYRLIRQGKIRADEVNEYLQIPDEEQQRLLAERTDKDTFKDIRAYLQDKRGMTYEAAKKWVQRRKSKGLGSKEIAEEALAKVRGSSWRNSSEKTPLKKRKGAKSNSRISC
ncbi:helix-turn-helix domain-containing protein [Acidobacteria bacterium AH-259-G07]|nr:helix-turn-helix domain-containing protein [Acidobacteria bacterium AH-259-G07]